MKKNLLIIFFLLFITIPSFAKAKEGVSYSYVINKVEERKLYNDKRWKALLHYSGNKSFIDEGSDFFLSPKGHVSPKSEMYATIEAMFDASRKGNDRIVCDFPARVDYIARELNIYSPEFEPIRCLHYENFDRKVPVDDISVIFAAENNEVPTSIMGHIFLKFSGNTEGQYREHAFSYFAVNPDTTSPKFYTDVIFSRIDGMYYLTPYGEKRDRYLYEEQRSIWEIDLKVSEIDKRMFKKHLWELRKKEIGYSFIFHNCGTAVETLLNILYPNQDFNKPYKLFETPMDYVLYLNKNNNISDVRLIPSPEYELKQIRNNYSLLDFYKSNKSNDLANALDNYNKSIKNKKLEDRKEVFGKKTTKNLKEANHSSRLYLGYKKLNEDAVEFDFIPVYQDFVDSSSHIYDDISTRIFSINGAYGDRLYIDSIDLINTRSIVDASFSYKAISKHMKFAFENKLGKENTSIKPVAEFGAGYAYDLANQTIKPYFLPKVGYRYDDIHNFYFIPELGLILKPIDNIKIVGSYEKYFDSKDNNVGFKEKYSVNISYAFSRGYGMYANYNKYSGVDSGKNEELRTGLQYHF